MQSPFDVFFYHESSFNLSLSEEYRLVTRDNKEGSSIVYLAEDLGVEDAINFSVESVDAPERGSNELSLKVGFTTCDSSIVSNFPAHLIEPCQPSHDCMGKTMTVNVKNANLIGDEIRVERKAGDELRVLVNGATVFSLTDPHDSIFPFNKGAAYPFLMLCGTVSSVRSLSRASMFVGDGVESTPVVVQTQTRQRSDSCCVICMDKCISHMAVPCNHAAFCDADATEQMKNSKVCPVCRRRVTNFVRIFIP